jgi:hypothetical protein
MGTAFISFINDIIKTATQEEIHIKGQEVTAI